MAWKELPPGDLATIIAGALGGSVRWLTLRENWREGAVSIFVGAVCALYVSPFVLPVLAPVLGRLTTDTSRIGNFGAFVVGLGGITVAGFFIDAWKMRRRILDARNGKDEAE